MDFIGAEDGWGRDFGREIHGKLVNAIDAQASRAPVKLSMEGIRKVDVSFSSEAIVEVARRYQKSRGFCLVDLGDPGVIENIDAAAARSKFPVVIWNGSEVRVIGLEPSAGNREALAFALAHRQVRAAEFADTSPGMSIANASTKFKQLWEQGFLLRTESAADSGGVEFLYERIG